FQPVDPWEDRVKWTDNQIDVFSKAFQGLTVSCARCHDHKFDAISQKDFYALFGVFAGARPVQKAIDLPEHLNRNREQLERLRLDIRDKLVEAWLEAAPSLTAAEATKHLAVKAKTQWDLRKDFNQWLSLGTNVRLAPPGEFAIEPNGAQVISGIYPGGVYTHLLSPKHNGVIQSPRFKIDTDFISVRMLGGNFSFAQLIIENYPVPRGGIYNIRHSPKKDEMSWTRWDVAYWKGFTAYVEFATMEDATHFFFDDEALGMKPRPEPKRDGRSWFGAQQVVFHNAKELPKEESVHGAQSLEDAIRAWRSGNMTEDQAAFLDHFVRRGLLPNTLEKLPGLKPLVAEYRKLEEEVPVPRRAPAVLEESAPDQLLLIRGNHKSPGEAVPRRYLSALGSRTYDDPRLVRLRLAEEVASADNPLTARVMVNRLWSYYFRQGIVRTVDNFGKLGEPPSNPELLDWLATRFIADGWSIKKMTRLLVTSRAYQAGMPLRRLEAEEIRDAVLAVSGELDLAMYGPSVPVYYAHETGKTKGDRPKGPLDGKGRRSVYLEIRRNATNPFLEVFDAPKPASTRGARDVTNVPAQSLAMMNSDFMIDQADRWAGRLVADGAWTPADRVDRMFARAFGRVPSSEERDLSLSLIEDFAREHKAADVSGDRRVWRDFAQALFSLKEFVYVR
ncbi:MAG: DUF1553 domain-containing protein, partial [Acidobacteria bacterium]|nr:DUF1553 domain-containing protein [Acidobacteriota bacterium]